MIENAVLVFGLIAIGSIMKRTSVFPTNTADVLNSFVLNVSLPAIIIFSISRLNISSEIIFPILFHWSLYFLQIIIVLTLSRALSFSKSIVGCLLVVTCLGNTAFLGIPVVAGFFGEVAIPYAVLYDQLGSGLAFIFTMAFILPKFTGQEARGIRDSLLGLFKFPPFVALLLGFLFIFFPLHGLIDNLVERVSRTLIPCAMIAVGFQMKYRMSAEKIKPIAVGLSIKLILMPAIAFLAYKFLQTDTLAIKVSVIQSGMPPMVTAGALAMSSNLEKEVSAALVGYGLLISFLTLPLLKFLI